MIHHSAFIVRPYAARGARLWCGVRLLIVTLSLVGEPHVSMQEAMRWTLGGALGVLACCWGLAFVDIRVRRERALLGNLGVGEQDVTLLYVAPAAIGELLLMLTSLR